MPEVYVYVIRSLANRTLYVGISKEIERRLKEHNQGKSKYTQSYRPWELIYKEVCQDYKSARKREKYLKSAAGKNFIKKKINPP